jgi:predicted nucleotide-binding protein
MDQDGTRILALVGLSNHDLILIKSLAKLSAARPCKYRVAASTERSSADVFIVNGDDAFAMKEAQNLVAGRPLKIVHVKKEAKGLNGHPTMLQPLQAKVVFGTLDKL